MVCRQVCRGPLQLLVHNHLQARCSDPQPCYYLACTCTHDRASGISRNQQGVAGSLQEHHILGTSMFQASEGGGRFGYEDSSSLDGDVLGPTSCGISDSISDVQQTCY